MPRVRARRRPRRAVASQDRPNSQVALAAAGASQGEPDLPRLAPDHGVMAPPSPGLAGGEPGLQLAILGPLQICVTGREISLPQAKLRQLLATLALRANKVVANDTLIRELWADQPPATALRALRVYVSQLRKFFARHEVSEDQCRLVTQSPGYRLILADGVLDCRRFDAYCDQARAAAAEGRLESSARLYRAALALHRGSALADVRLDSPTLESSALWLDEARLSMLMRCLDADLRLGRHLDVVSELTSLVAEHPLNEGLHSRLMIALYRCGRTSDALRVYRAIRDLMVEEIGTEPGLEIRRVQQAVLAADPVALEHSDLWTL